MTRLDTDKLRLADAPEPRIQPMPDGIYWRAGVEAGAGSIAGWLTRRMIAAIVTLWGIYTIFWLLDSTWSDGSVRYLVG